MKLIVNLMRGAALAAVLGLSGAPARADDAAANYPSKPIRLIAPFAPGALTDTLARLIGNKMSVAWGQPVVVENRPGAAGAIGTAAVANSPPDGYTLVVITSGHVINPNFTQLPYDPVKSFEPVILLTEIPNLVAVHPSVPVKTLDEYVKLVKANPKDYAYATSGAGGSSHITMEWFKTVAKLDNAHVSYKGGSLAITDLAAGHIKTAMSTVPTGFPYVDSGRVRAIAVSSKKRSPVLPDVPTLEESGYPVVSVEWWGVLAPAGTPLAIREKLNAEIARIMKMPDVEQKLSQIGVAFTGGSIAQFDEFLKDEMVKWARVIKEANVKNE
ncbi:tripartite tricarboxylate transporter substrate binding protein [Xanthobacter tagetidis]|jgi:tripartite-type tricarboxylate transporter receptor subunit TctC|uniref:Tripartite tricarboxylate transporter substrate binding protein n=1 Tax=Xanthobacter tagetidis TaxID=60216 RepID=A0A3L7A3H8_9HYPH|nr:tripartite tricarboxylate transporter substrate binding protein [Xanthobacter tagetidis]MBB6308847.1 tripartite-type tricarboxylate transporter receptor subunit TctC [Xanthobacter tagetidis]RLP74896.1 tripartite tricarboxylate transporter substrate binding protein [Xanthobacter tagetidis]